VQARNLAVASREKPRNRAKNGVISDEIEPQSRVFFTIFRP
jgi:hypothetical protein